MDIDKEQQMFEQIESYLMGQMSAEELQAFEQRIAREPDLAREVEQQRFFIQAASDYQLKQQISVIHKQAMAIYRRDRTMWRGLYTLAGVVLLSGVIGLSLYGLYTPAEELSLEISKELNPAHTEPVACKNTTRAAGNTQHVQVSELLLTYQKCDYQGTIDLYEKYPVGSGIPTEAAFYAGNAYLAANQPAKAHDCFLKVVGASMQQPALQADYKQTAQWYLATMDLKTSKPELAEAMFTQLDPSHSFYLPLGLRLLQFYINTGEFEKATALAGQLPESSMLMKIRLKLLDLAN